MKWNEGKAQEIIKKHKSRFSFRLTFKIIRVFFAVFLLYAIYMIIVSISYDHSNVGARTLFYQKLAIDWTYPELSSKMSDSDNQITPLLTQKITFPLEKRIGKSNYTVSQLNLSKSILTSFIHVELANNYPHDTETQGFKFYLPYHPKSDQTVDKYENSQAWNTLEMIHEGNVANLAFSTDEYHSPNELLELVSQYDLDVLWMPLYMGEMEEFTEGLGGSDDSISLYPQFGLSGARVVDDDYWEYYLINGLNSDTVAESQEAMLQNMKTMLQEKKGLAEDLLGTNHLQERYDYLNEHGFQAFGAVVTGPVKELLKLQELESIHNVELGEITYWNWD